MQKLFKVSSKYYFIYWILVLAIINGILVGINNISIKTILAANALPFVIFFPGIGLYYILLEAWLTKGVPLFDTHFISELLTPSIIISIILILYYLQKSIRSKKKLINLCVLDVLVTIFFGYLVISSILITQRTDFTILNNLVFYFIIRIIISTEKQIKTLFVIFIIASFCLSLTGYYELISLKMIPTEGIKGIFQNHVQFSWICWMGIPLGIILFGKETDTLKKTLLLAVIFLLALMVGLSLTRSVILTMLFTFPLFLGTKRNLAIYIIIALIFLTLAIAIPEVSQRLGSLKELSMDLSTINRVSSGRIGFYDAAIKMFKESPIIGMGYKSFPFEWMKFSSREFVGYAVLSDKFMSAHSTFLQIAAELGVIGLSLYTLIFYSFFKNLALGYENINLLDYSKAIRIIGIGFLVMSLIDNGGWGERYFYLFLAFSCIVNQIHKQSLSIKHE